MSNLVAIVGRPNVGKSTLFNRLTQTRRAIVNEEAGTTRDRQYGKVDWNGQEFSLVDTGGWIVNSDDIFEEEIRKQVKIAIEEADLILFVVDVMSGVTDLDEQVAQILRQNKKPVILVSNKVDSNEMQYYSAEFYKLGLGDPYCISALSGFGTGDLMDLLVSKFKKDTAEELDEEIPRFAVVGRPNAGKSSILNAFIGEERTIVTDIPGTTRDSIYTRYNKFGKDFYLVDTAGIRETDNVVEQIGVDKAQQFVKNADLVLYVVDAVQGLTDEDREMLAEIKNQHVIYLMNKSDVGITDEARVDFANAIGGAPVLEISAREKLGLDQLEQSIMDLFFSGTLEVQNDIMVTNVRHIQILEESAAHMEGFLTGLSLGMSVDFLVIDLQNAWEKLGKITGETVEEDLLDQIFSKFCLGK